MLEAAPATGRDAWRHESPNGGAGERICVIAPWPRRLAMSARRCWPRALNWPVFDATNRANGLLSANRRSGHGRWARAPLPPQVSRSKAEQRTVASSMPWRPFDVRRDRVTARPRRTLQWLSRRRESTRNEVVSLYLRACRGLERLRGLECVAIVGGCEPLARLVRVIEQTKAEQLSSLRLGAEALEIAVGADNPSTSSKAARTSGQRPSGQGCGPPRPESSSCMSPKTAGALPWVPLPDPARGPRPFC